MSLEIQHECDFEYYLDLAHLDRRWLQRHVSCGEATGAAVNVALFGDPFGALFELVQEGDNLVEKSVITGRTKTADAAAIAAALRNTHGYRTAKHNLSFQHSYGHGFAVGYVDAGSRQQEHKRVPPCTCI